MNMINEIKYGCMLEVVLFYPEGKHVFSVGKKYPCFLDNDAQGEALIIMDNSLYINILWSNILEEETKFLHSLCEGMSIYKDPLSGIVYLGFIFSGKPVIVRVIEEESFIHDWIKRECEGMNAYFFMIEATNKEIIKIRNLGFQRDYIVALKEALIDYKKPNIDTLMTSLNINPSIIFNKAEFRWIYSEDHDKFLFIPKEIET